MKELENLLFDRNDFSPKEFMKQRRPERFSDSEKEEYIQCDRSFLEYHLSKITSKIQENDFARFAQHLCEREICPNLLPQTGPIGGGDSKVDSESYPVSEDLELIWLVGGGNKSNNERWAFAFSAMAKWEQKVKSDIKKIFETKRGYSNAFYVSNQYVRDKKRAATEDELSKKYNIRVTILDLNWILDKVLSGKHFDLLISDLKIGLQKNPKYFRGSNDRDREHRLEEIEKNINRAVNDNNINWSIVEESIEAGIISRELEKPDTQTDGYFIRAKRLSEQYGTERHLLECLYQWAWTNYWWYENYTPFLELYEQIESIALKSPFVYDIERLFNLWYLSFSLVSNGKFDEQEMNLRIKEKRILKALGKLAEEESSRPSNSLQAQSLVLINELFYSPDEKIKKIFVEIKDLLYKANKVIGYSFDSTKEIIVFLGNLYANIKEYDELIEALANIESERSGEKGKAFILLENAKQHLLNESYLKTIKTVGKVFVLLYKNESKQELLKALLICGNAYERIGLLWAARSLYLNAASLAIDDYWKKNELNNSQVLFINKLKWVDLQIGRLSNALEWHRLHLIIQTELVEDGELSEEFFLENGKFDIITGILFLKCEINELKKMENLPDVLVNLELPFSSDALKFSLGYENEDFEIVKKGIIQKDQTIYDFIQKWRDQPAADEIAEKIVLYENESVVLKSNCLGCEIKIISQNNLACIYLSETILSTTESLLSIGLSENIIPKSSSILININQSNFDDYNNVFLFSSNGRTEFNIKVNNIDLKNFSTETNQKINEKTWCFVCELIINNFIFSEEKNIKNIFNENNGFDRSIYFTGSFVATGNILGNEPKLKLSQWMEGNERKYEIKRADVWDVEDRKKKKEKQNEGKPIIMGDGEPPEEIFDIERIRHTDLKSVSLIDIESWDKAEWKGTAFLWEANNSKPPIFAPIFKNQSAGKTIFENWLKELGNFDENDKLRISIIRGVNKKNPLWYRVLIGTNLKTFENKNTKRLIITTRLHTMTPSSDVNLKGFLKNYRKHNFYFLTYCIIKGKEMEPFFNSCILKKEVNIRDAWEVGLNDIDCSGIRADDDPIIPNGKNNAPVLELLKFLRKG